MTDDFLASLQSGLRQHGGYQEGVVVDLRAAAHKKLYLIGDIHAKTPRIADVFAHADLYAKLERDEAVVVFLGDLFHREETDRAGEMETSVETLLAVMELKTRFPRSLYILLGNHEFTRTERCKHSYFQGALFRKALEQRGLGEFYERFIEASPLVVIHPRCVGVHAAPARCIKTLEELKRVPVSDATALALHPAVIELTCHRHVNWSPYGEKAYNDYEVDDFLALCGVPGTHLVTGHTPICRETGWEWPMGPRNTVIFAAGRELGYLRADAESLEFVRVGRSLLSDDDTLLWDRTPVPLALPEGQILEQTGGKRAVRISDLTRPHELRPDVLYRFDYPGCPVTIQINELESVSVRNYRHLTPGSQAYYPLGYYLVGNESRQELLKLKRDQALVLQGGSSLCMGVRFSLPHLGPQEAFLLTQWEEGQFELRPLIEGIRLG